MRNRACCRSCIPIRNLYERPARKIDTENKAPYEHKDNGQCDRKAREDEEYFSVRDDEHDTKSKNKR